MRDQMSDNSSARLTRLEEKRIIRAVQAGDQQAARVLIDQHKQRLFAFVWRLVSNHQDAEDICQEAFLKALSSIDSFDPTYRFSTWIFTIAYRLGLNHFRRRQKAPLNDLDLSCFESDTEPATAELAESEEARRLKKMVWEAVARLSGPQQAAITLFYRESISCKEIADIMSVPVATVKSHLHRARVKLRELLLPVCAGDANKLRILKAVAG